MGNGVAEMADRPLQTPEIPGSNPAIDNLYNQFLWQGQPRIGVFLNGPFPGSFSYFHLFNAVDSKQINVRYYSLPIAGFEARTSGVGSDCSTN